MKRASQYIFYELILLAMIVGVGIIAFQYDISAKATLVVSGMFSYFALSFGMKEIRKLNKRIEKLEKKITNKDRLFDE